MKVLGECEECGHKWKFELKSMEEIQCPNCKSVFNMLKIMNDPQNEDFRKNLYSYLQKGAEKVVRKHLTHEANCLQEQLTKAKELLKKFVDNVERYSIDNDIINEAEQFLEGADNDYDRL